MASNDELIQLAQTDIDVDRLNRIEACKTYLEQTKLLVTLASAFIVAPAALFALDATKLAAIRPFVCTVLAGESAFVASVFAGYLTLGTLAGSQHKGTFYVSRPATMVLSWVQIVSYLAGLAQVSWLFFKLLKGAA